jgi:succinoglycan biosynthesis transport protein ExoP
MDLTASKKPILSQEDFAASEISDNEPNLRAQLDVVIRRKRPFLIVFVLLLLLGIVYILTRHKIYEAEAKIKVATTSAGSLSSGGDLLGALSSLTQGTDVATEAEIINSTGLLSQALYNPPQSVIDEMKTGEDYTLPKNYLKVGFGIVKVNQPYPKWISDVTVVKDTSIVSVKVKSFSPQIAQFYANSISQTYLARSLKQNNEATDLGRIFVQKKIKNIQQELNDATAQLANFQKKSGLISPDSQVQAESDQLLSLRLASEQAKQDLAAAQSKADILKGQVKGSTSEVLASRTITENPEFGSVRAHLADLRDQLLTASKDYQPGSTVIRRLKKSIKEEENRLNSLAKSLVTGIEKERNPNLDALMLSYATAVADQAMAADRTQFSQKLYDTEKSYLATYPTQARTYAELSRKSGELSRTLALLTDKWYELLITEESGIPSAQIAEEASVPLDSTYPKKALMGIGVLFGSLALAIGFIAVLERFDSSLHNPDDIPRLTGLATLAAIPKSAENKPLIGSLKNQHAFLEGFRLLRNGIQFSSPDRKIKTLVITSSTAGEGKSTVSANLAIAVAMDGKKVLLVDCDLRRPNVHKIFELDKSVGFTSLIAGQSTLAQAVQSTPYAGVSVLTSGPLPPDPTEFLHSEKTALVLRELAEVYDFIILDSPPTMGISDVQVLSTMGDAVAMVVALDTVAKQHLIASIHLLRRANANILGTVLNKLESRGGAYGYLSSYYYTYYSNYTDES